MHDMVHAILKNDARQRVLVLHASRAGASPRICDKTRRGHRKHLSSSISRVTS